MLTLVDAEDSSAPATAGGSGPPAIRLTPTSRTARAHTLTTHFPDTTPPPDWSGAALPRCRPPAMKVTRSTEGCDRTSRRPSQIRRLHQVGPAQLRRAAGHIDVAL